MFKSKNLRLILEEAYDNAVQHFRDPFKDHRSDVYICNADGEYSDPPVTDGTTFELAKFEKYLSEKGAEYIISKCASHREYDFVAMTPIEGGGFAFTFVDTCDEETGWRMKRIPKQGAIYEIEELCGGLFACGNNVRKEIDRTFNITFVLKQMLVDDEWITYMDDLYPGVPAPRPNLYGLNPGDKISFKDCVDRRITEINWTCLDETMKK